MAISTSASGYAGRILMVCMVILLCITAGCMNFGATGPGGGQGGQAGPGGSSDYSAYVQNQNYYNQKTLTEETYQLSLSYSEKDKLDMDCESEDTYDRGISKLGETTTTKITINSPVILYHESNALRCIDQTLPATVTFSEQRYENGYGYKKGVLDSAGESDESTSGSVDHVDVTIFLQPESPPVDCSCGNGPGMIDLHVSVPVTTQSKNREYTCVEGWIGYGKCPRVWTDYRIDNSQDDQIIHASCEYCLPRKDDRYNEESSYKVTDSGYSLKCIENFYDPEQKDRVDSPACGTRTTEKTLTASLTPYERKPLKAVPGGPYFTTRGNLVQLIGIKSTGSISEYRWTFKTASGCPAGVSLDGAELKGVSPQVTLLCPVTATLTVTDGKDTDSASVPVTVVPRDWETTPTMSAEGIDRGPMARPPYFDQSKFEGGANICGLCAGTPNENSDILHPAPVGGSWEKSGGYEITQVTEPGGPFDGYWYVSKYSMEMNREIVVNPYLLPLASGGKELPYAMGSFYQKNKDSGYDVDGYLYGIRLHEQDHTDRMKAALQSSDPAEAIEQLSGMNRDDVKNSVDTKLRETKKKICEKSNDASQPPMKVTWSGKLLFPTSATNQWKEGQVSVGGYRQLEPGETCS